MKKITILGWITILATLPLIFSNTSFAAEWRPIAEITDLEKGIIAQASQQSPDWIYKNAKAFRVKHGVVVEILLKDGTVKYYAAGRGKNLTGNNEFWTKDEKDLKERALEISKEFQDIWFGKKGDELNVKELERADNLMYEYINILKTDTLITNYILWGLRPLVIGNRGKRYLHAFQELFLGTDHTIEFYAAFVTSMNHTLEDQPNDQEKVEAIEKIKELLRQRDKTSDYYFDILFLYEAGRLDPDFNKTLVEIK